MSKKVALVTGGSMGLGAAVAERLLFDKYYQPMTQRQMPDCPWCHEPMYRRDLDLEDEPWFLTDWSLMHHACLVDLRSAIERHLLPNSEGGARAAIALVT